ncbi:MAG: TrkH family potassium uptake protein [Candidatus Bathyarchaeia archaeon]|jgi:trk system potassium uptake protein TrkH
MKSSIAVLLANMGFVLQLSGIFILVPIVVSFLCNETDATVALFIAATAFMALGFCTNALCEKKEMTYRQSCILIVSVFVIMSLIGSIPYLYLSLPSANILQTVTDSIFESVSGFTTTGFSVIPDLSALPQSIILYRALTQFIGGIGIVIVLLSFFYPEAKLREFAKSMGLGNGNYKIKKTFLFIISLYCAFTIAMIIIGYLGGYRDLISLSSIVFSSISTGGFSPVVDFAAIVSQQPLNIIIPISMIFGATNFLLFGYLYKKRFKDFFNSQLTIFLIIAGLSTFILYQFFNLSIYDSMFHIVSAMSTTGFNIIPIDSMADSLKLFLVSLMFIGGASFSTAGGIKIYRLVLMLKSIKKGVVYAVSGKDEKLKVLGKEYSNSEVIQSAALVFLTALIIFVSALIVSYYGFRPIDALFDCTSAIATTGLSAGVVGPSLALELKWLFMFLMLMGRVEILSFLVIFTRGKERPMLASQSLEESAVVTISAEA